MLTDVPVIHQQNYQQLVEMAIQNGDNVLVLGPSGGGKTFMTEQVVNRAGCRMIYINLAVLERPDLQGMPLVSTDRRFVNYAAPAFLPFADLVAHNELNSLQKLKEALESDSSSALKMTKAERAASLKELDAKIQEVQARQTRATVMDSLNAFTGRDPLFQKLAAAASETGGEPIVILFDEADKAQNEVMQTLLEFLQFHSINGRKMNVKACFLTGNLPDEHAHVNQISHAITKRCKTFKLELDFKQFREHAIKAGFHPHVIGFLMANTSNLYKKAPEGDPTAYALPSPRTWEMVSKICHDWDRHNYADKYPDSQDLKYKQIAGAVGTTCAVNMKVWVDHYHRLDSHVNALLEKGTHPKAKDLNEEDNLMIAINSCYKVYESIKHGNEEQYHAYIKNVSKWVIKLPKDYQACSWRMAFGGDINRVKEFKLAKIPEFMDVFKGIMTELEKNGLSAG